MFIGFLQRKQQGNSGCKGKKQILNSASRLMMIIREFTISGYPFGKTVSSLTSLVRQNFSKTKEISHLFSCFKF